MARAWVRRSSATGSSRRGTNPPLSQTTGSAFGYARPEGHGVTGAPGASLLALINALLLMAMVFLVCAAGHKLSGR